MPLSLIEREFVEAAGDIEAEGVAQTVDYNDDHDLRWLFSFLSADKRRSYCLYEAVDADALRKHAEDLGIPADKITEVSELNPELWEPGGSVSGHPAK